MVASRISRRRPRSYSAPSWLKPAFNAGMGVARDLAMGHIGRKIESYTNTLTQPKKKRKTTKPSFVTSASYKGRFRGRAKRRRVPKSSAPKSKEFYAERGITYDVETNGSISDANCVYLGHCSFSPWYLVKCTMQALMRKLFCAAFRDWSPTSISDVIPLSNFGTSSNGFQLRFTSVNAATGLSTNTDVTLGLSETIETLSENTVIIGLFVSAATQFGFKLTNVVLCSSFDSGLIGAGGYFNRNTLATLELDTAVVSYFSKSDLKVQNVTVPDATNLESTDVNNVPLVGRLYNLNTPYPNTKRAHPLKLNWVNADTGMCSHYAGDPSSNNQAALALKEPPAPGFFYGCKSSILARLEPGSIKKSVVTSSRSMPLNAFLRAVSYTNAVGIPANNNITTTTLGGSKVLALERVISVQGTLPIKCFYENNVSMGVYISTKASKFTLGGFAQLNPSAIGPT